MTNIQPLNSHFGAVLDSKRERVERSQLLQDVAYVMQLERFAVFFFQTAYHYYEFEIVSCFWMLLDASQTAHTDLVGPRAFQKNFCGFLERFKV